MKAIILPPTKTPVITPTPGAWHVDSVRGIITIVAERWDRETAQAFVVGWGWDPVKTSVEIAGLLNGCGDSQGDRVESRLSREDPVITRV